jgi:hypothetical protein
MTMDREPGLATLTEAEVAEMEQLGIVRRPIDSFSVGAFRYSSLKDAVAQAKRHLQINPRPVLRSDIGH